MPPIKQELFAEIEAIPPEHWEELLLALQRFRDNATHPQPIVINAQQLQKNQAAIALLQSWVEEGDTQAWETLKTNLDADRLSDRPLFP